MEVIIQYSNVLHGIVLHQHSSSTRVIDWMVLGLGAIKMNKSVVSKMQHVACGTTSRSIVKLSQVKCECPRFDSNRNNKKTCNTLM